MQGRNDRVQRGFVAQDVEKVMPEWVSTNDKGDQQINMDSLVPMLVDSVKTLKTENDDLKSHLSAIENSRKIVLAGNAWGFGIGGLGIGLAMVISRRKRDDQTEAAVRKE